MNSVLPWERLPLLAMIFFFFSSLRLAINTVVQALPVFAGLFIIVERVRDALPLIFLACAVVLLLSTVLRYRRFFFVTEAQRIRVRQGVFRKVELNLDFDRIQQADVEQPLYFRPFGLAILKLQSAGSKGQEVEIAGVPFERAKQVQHRILAEQQSLSERVDDSRILDESGASFVTHQPDFGFTLRTGDILRIGLMQNIFVVVGVLATLFFSNPHVSKRTQNGMEAMLSQFPSPSEAALVMGGLAFLVLTLFVLGSVLFYFNQYYGYTLIREGDRVRYRAGFASTLTRSFRVQKLQHVDIRQTWMGRLLSRYEIKLSQAGGQTQKQEGKFTIPCVDLDRLAEIRSDLRLTQACWQPVHWAYFPQYVLLLTLIVGIFFGLWAAFAACLLLLLIRLRWWLQFAYHFDGEWLAVRHGFIGSRERWMPAAKMQAVTCTQGLVQRWLGVADLHISSAAGVFHILYMPLAQAKALQSELLKVTRSDYRRWM